MADTTTRNDELELLLRRAIEVANEIRPGFVMENLLRQALAAAGVDEWAPPKFDPDPRPAGADAPGPPVVTTLATPGGEHRNLKPDAAKKDAERTEKAVREARELRRKELGVTDDDDAPLITAADLEDEAPERETPTTDPNGPNHDENPDVNRMGRFNDNGAGMSLRDDLNPDQPTDTRTDSDTGTTVDTGSTPGPAAAKENQQ